MDVQKELHGNCMAIYFCVNLVPGSALWIYISDKVQYMSGQITLLMK